ncbi:MAG: hypothetical protein O3C40_00250 [Planctomycetota bacterium]|nr:hypothetical protein [Planctomycetota bacterium]
MPAVPPPPHRNRVRGGLPDPDPANQDKREFGWMTVHSYKANKPVSQPFKDLSSLDVE